MFTVGPALWGGRPSSLVTLLMRGEGTEGGTVFTDSSVYAWPLVANSSTTTSDALGVVAGTRAINVSGMVADRGVRFNGDAINTMGTNDFTVEGWVTVSDTISTTPRLIWKLTNATGDRKVLIGLGNNFSSGLDIYFSVDCSSFGGSGRAGTVAFTTGTPHHVCYMRAGALQRIYVDGVQKYNFAGAVSGSSFDLSGRIHVGGLTTGDPDVAGYLGLNGAVDEFRVTRKAMYATGGFTVPTPPLTEIVN